MKKLVLTLGFAILTMNSFAASDKIDHGEDLQNKIHEIVKSHYEKYKDQEFFSAISIAISMPNKPIITDFIGTMSHAPKSKKINADSLFEIGSITKSFTTAVVLKAAEKKDLKLTDKLKKYFTNYPFWNEINITQLLNMTSGLPNYSDTPSMNYLISKNPEKFWLDDELVDLAYPKSDQNPPLKQGYFYTNTGYTLTSLILEKIYNKPFSTLIEDQIIKPLELKSTYYLKPKKSNAAYKRVVHGFGFNQYENPTLVGSDLLSYNLSWAGPAGGIVATPTDVARWVRDLFENQHFLTAAQRKEMMQLVATDSGKPINNASAEHPKGFALGIAQNYSPSIGRFWFYEGETLGFRTLYMYIPSNHIIIVAAFNSATNNENDHAHELLTTLNGAV